MKRFFIFNLFLVLFSGLFLSTYSKSSKAFEFLNKGDFKNFKLFIEKEYLEDSLNPEISLLYFSNMSNASVALPLLKKIALNKSLPDSIRSEAYFRLGCASYIWGRYQKASEYFINAAGLSGQKQKVEACYLNAIYDTSDTAFLSTIKNAAEDTSLSISKAANYYLGLFYYKNKKYKQAFSHFVLSLEPERFCESYAGAYLSKSLYSKKEYIDSIYKILSFSCLNYLEKPLVEKTASGFFTLNPKPSFPIKDTLKESRSDLVFVKKDYSLHADSTLKKQSFTLQIGSFGALENAQITKTKLSKDFSNISIKEGIVDGKTVYRVRIGSFESREKAIAFGDSVLLKKGIKFIVVEE